VTDGRISKLLINFPPRCGKTIITSVCWIAWTWARRERTFRSGPQVRFLTGSYSHTLALGNANVTRRLILSPFYQRLWGSRFTFRDDQNTKVQVDNSEGGSRLATSVGGTLWASAVMSWWSTILQRGAGRKRGGTRNGIELVVGTIDDTPERSKTIRHRGQSCSASANQTSAA
jgi:hypothetical protein